jgi:hypothetical protein
MAGAERNALLGSFEFNPYAAGKKIYGNMTYAPTRGKVDKSGYAARDARIAAKKAAVLAKMKANNVGAYANENALRFSK